MYNLRSTQSKLVVRIMVSMFSRVIPPNPHLSPGFTLKSKLKFHLCHLCPPVSQRENMINKLKVHIIDQKPEGDRISDNHNTMRHGKGTTWPWRWFLDLDWIQLSEEMCHIPAVYCVTSQEDGHLFQQSQKCSKTCTCWSWNWETAWERSSQAYLALLKRTQMPRLPRKLQWTRWTEAFVRKNEVGDDQEKCLIMHRTSSWGTREQTNSA